MDNRVRIDCYLISFINIENLWEGSESGYNGYKIKIVLYLIDSI